MLAMQRQGERMRERLLADAARAVEEVGVRKLVGPDPPEVLDDARLIDKRLGRLAPRRRLYDRFRLSSSHDATLRRVEQMSHASAFVPMFPRTKTAGYKQYMMKTTHRQALIAMLAAAALGACAHHTVPMRTLQAQLTPFEQTRTQAISLVTKAKRVMDPMSIRAR